jgi:hypothetical protein
MGDTVDNIESLLDMFDDDEVDSTADFMRHLLDPDSEDIATPTNTTPDIIKCQESGTVIRIAWNQIMYYCNSCGMSCYTDKYGLLTCGHQLPISKSLF